MNKTIIKIYVGSTIEQWLAYKVLEYTIRKHTNAAVDIKPLYENNITWKLPKDPENQPATPFSFQRFLIPELNEFKGKAIYLDSDMQLFTDIGDLWNRSMGDTEIFAVASIKNKIKKPQFSVMLINCDYFKYRIQEVINLLDNGSFDYLTLMTEMKVAKKVKVNIESEWNSLDFYEKDKTKLLHYTNMSQQPWLYNSNPLAYLWVTALKKSIEKKFLSLKELKLEIKKGHVKPSLYYQVVNNKLDNTRLPFLFKLSDRFFIPPHIRNGTIKQLVFNQISRLSANLFYPVQFFLDYANSFLKKHT